VIQEIEMKDFMRYIGRASKLRFTDRFTVITGKTGSGKTSILDAVTFTLYKRTRFFSHREETPTKSKGAFRQRAPRISFCTRTGVEYQAAYLNWRR
jgi:DNA repair exonuclease SbcCD ATPase subunit